MRKTIVDSGAANVLADLDGGDTPLTVSEARALFTGRGGKRPDIGTIHRLFVAGSTAADGTRVRLEFAKLSNGRVTTATAIKRFHRRLNCLDARVAKSDASAAHKLADAKLAAAGW